jgi:CHAD domain-containing protein
MVRDYALRKRKRQMSRARRKLANRKLFTLALNAPKLIKPVPGPHNGQDPDPRSVLVVSVRKSYAQWHEGLSRACESLNATDIHAFRIQTKRLRYGIELAADLGDGEAQAALASLKMLQDELGRWHDQTELARLAAEALADPEFLMAHPRAVAAILRKMDRAQALHIERIRRLLATMHRAVGQSPLHAWLARYCDEPPWPALQKPDLAVLS